MHVPHLQTNILIFSLLLLVLLSLFVVHIRQSTGLKTYLARKVYELPETLYSVTCDSLRPGLKSGGGGTDLRRNLEEANQIAFITAVFGHYEKTLKLPAAQDTETTFIAFTDRKDLNSSKSVWQIVEISDEFWNSLSEQHGRNAVAFNTHSFNKAKYFKLQWNKIQLLTQFNYIVWIDATVRLVSPQASSTVKYMMGQGLNAVTFEHKRRGLLSNEVAVSLKSGKYMTDFWQGQKQPLQNVTEQYQNYTQSGFYEKWWLKRDDVPWWVIGRPEYGVYVTCFLAWNANLNETSEFLDMWWQENVQSTTQDQITFPYVAWKLSLYAFPLPQGNVSGNADNNILYEKMPHGM